MRRAIAAAAIFFLIVPGVHASSVKDDVKKGNLLYNNQKYDEAVKAWRAGHATTDMPMPY